ncbi:hypothetical protein AB0G73_24185 [Streptomyces sp. NPDC020719]|uniref:hypothetical protein n=1 Tax=Streptomyces sp. NPDC020719 TaxID=3154896 RepID=UPI00340C8BA3
MYIPRTLRLRDPEQVLRWEQLAAHARQVPPRPGSVAYVNALRPEWEMAARRDRRDPQMVLFMRYAAEDMDGADEPGPDEETHVVVTEYKVATTVPFVVRHVEAVHLGDRGRRPKDRGPGLRGRLRILRMALTTGALQPSAAELDEIVQFLEHATPEPTG